jgi:hypothetical protein
VIYLLFLIIISYEQVAGVRFYWRKGWAERVSFVCQFLNVWPWYLVATLFLVTEPSLSSQVETKEESREYIKDWLPGSGCEEVCTWPGGERKRELVSAFVWERKRESERIKQKNCAWMLCALSSKAYIYIYIYIVCFFNTHLAIVFRFSSSCPRISPRRSRYSPPSSYHCGNQYKYFSRANAPRAVLLLLILLTTALLTTALPTRTAEIKVFRVSIFCYVDDTNVTRCWDARLVFSTRQHWKLASNYPCCIDKLSIWKVCLNWQSQRLHFDESEALW